MKFSIVNAIERNLHKVGEYTADYSQLTPEEIQKPIPEMDEVLQRSLPLHVFDKKEYRVEFCTSAEADEYQKVVPKNLFRREGNTLIANHEEYLEYLRQLQQRELKNAFRL